MAWPQVGLATGPWKHLTDTADGIRVSARVDAKIKVGDTLAKAVIKAPVAKVWGVLTALDHYVDFMPYMEASRVVRRTKAHVWQYCRTDTPIVSDRDYTLKFTLKPGDAKTPWRIDWVADNAQGPPPVRGVVRLDLVTGGWVLKSVQGGRATHVTYTLRTAPGGSIPMWVANLGNKRAIPDIIRAVRRRVAR